MPYKCRTTIIPRRFDRRVKLTTDEREEIKYLYNVEGQPIRAIARTFKGKCSRRMIQFILFPERADTAKINLKRRRKENPPTKAEMRKYAKSHRRYKAKLHVSGVLKFPFYCRIFYRKSDFKKSRRFIFGSMKEAKGAGARAARRGCWAQVGTLEHHPIAGMYSQEREITEYGVQNKGRRYWAERYQLKIIKQKDNHNGKK